MQRCGSWEKGECAASESGVVKRLRRWILFLRFKSFQGFPARNDFSPCVLTYLAYNSYLDSGIDVFPV